MTHYALKQSFSNGQRKTFSSAPVGGEDRQTAMQLPTLGDSELMFICHRFAEFVEQK